MSKIRLTIIFSILTLSLYSQKCKYRINTTDKFTGKINIAVGHQLYSGSTEYAEFAAVKNGDTLYSIFTYNEWGIIPSFEVDTSQSLLFKLANGSSISLRCEESCKSKYMSNSLSSKGISSITRVRLMLDEESIAKLIESPILILLLEHKGGQLLRDVKSKDGEALQFALKCFMESTKP